MAKNVQVTSVTPKAKVKASTEKEKASTRKLVGAIASVTPVGRGAKAAVTAVKTAKSTTKAAKTAAKAAANISKPVAKSKKAAAKITGVKSSGFKNPLPKSNAWTGGKATAEAARAGRSTDTMKPLSATDKVFGSGRKIEGVRTVKASSGTADKLNAIRTPQGTAREVAAARKAEQIRKAKAAQRMLDIKNGKR